MTMPSYGLCWTLVVLIIQTCTVHGQEEIIKSSLTFVIDNTASMHDEIYQVKEEVIIIFEKVLSSKASQIENFVLVTFNDPYAELRTITKDRDVFKRAVANIQLRGNYDCPEYAMKGIEYGLTASLPLSYLYVFTDAAASDYARFEEIKSIAQKKQCQIVFMLTGECDSRYSANYQVYNKIAEATGGQVFHMMKDDVKDILKYIEESITGRGVTLVNKKLPPGYGKKITYPVDARTGEVLISVTGSYPSIGAVTGPDGSKPTTESVVSGKREMAVLKVKNAKPGDHEVEVGSSSDTHAVITAKSDINFQLGFSIDRPNSMKDTVTRPAPEGNSFLGIKLLGNGVKLTKVKILDLSDNVVTELPLELVDEKEQFYVTPSFNPPFTMFRISIIGKDLKTDTPIERPGPTPIARQNPSAERKENTAPVITIQGAPKIITEYDAPLKLKCNVHGYPAPDIVWEEKDTGTRMPAKVQLVEVPYDYVGIVDIDKAIKNVTYQCKASNFLGTTIKNVEVETERKIYFDVIEAPTDIRVEYDKEGTLVCKVDAYPPASITWYKDGAVFSGNTNVDISSDKSILTIKHMQLELQGKYTCEAINDLDRKVFIANVVIFGVEAPVIDKSHEEIVVTEKTNAALSCGILKGIPKPAISWSFRPAGIDTFKVMKETSEIVHLNNVRKDQTGSYKCNAQNALGSDNFTMELDVEYPPTIKEDVKQIQIKDHDEVTISCDVTGHPTPAVSWFFNETRLDSTAKTRVSSDNSLKFKARPADTGSYRCEAVNKHGSAKKTAFLNVFQTPVIDKSHEEIVVTEKTNAALSCRMLEGIPKPAISWSFRPAGTDTFKVMKETSEIVHLNNVRKDQTGSYKCNAQNVLGSDSFTMELDVEYPPTIKEDVKLIQTKVHDEVTISCDVTGHPAPAVSWFFNETRLDSTAKTRVSSDNSLKFKTKLADTGSYRCEAVNKHGSAKKTAFLNVFQAPVIDKSHAEILVTEKTNAPLSCRILEGVPRPAISWSFRPAGIDEFRVMKETTETVHLNNVRKDQTGSYKCNAKNVLGSDSFTMELVVEYPPKIKEDVKLIQIKDGDEVTISCDVTGEPAPAVSWFFNDTRLDSTAETRVSSDNSLKFKARLADIGSYRCEAENKLGSAKKTTFLNVFIPVTIETPKKSMIEIMVGKSTILYCRADGYPKPNIKWTFQNSDPKIPVEDITPTGGVASVALKNMQLDQQGLYTCQAENGIGGSAHITYDVKVYAPPVIVNVYTSKVFEPVEGDFALRIQCKATGSPKPTIVWMKNGLNLAIGSEWYEMEDDGTLIIKNIDRESNGMYVCLAENVLGNDTEVYEVIVRDNLRPEIPTNTVFVEEGKTIDIKCDIPHMITDQIRWFKGGVPIASEELTLYNVKRSDDGLYTCRVSNPMKSRSVTTKVVIGFKPVFTTKEEETVQFVHGAETEILSCEANGQPRPMSAVWKHNGKELNTTAMSHPLGMVYGATGTYECEVSNDFGSIHRTFKVTSRDCILKIQKDFPEKQPIMYSPSLEWPVFPVNNGYMIIPHADYFYFNCPSRFSNRNLPMSNVVAFCERDSTIKIYGKPYNFADIQCNEEVKPQVLETGIPCFPGNTETIKIGFKVLSKFLGVYEVCLDKKNNVPLFTKHNLSPDHTDRSTEAEWSNSLLPQDFDTLYDCRRQMYDISMTLGRGLLDSCCFGKRQLVNSHNLLPGVPTSAAYDYLNVIPHWSTCNSKNWDDVEQSVRNLVKSAGRDLMITTGTANRSGPSTDITLHDGRGEKQPVAQFIWKVIQDPVQSASLAIIHVNIPELSADEASKYVLCPDICSNGISWIEPSNWQNVEDGYTYCCAITEFERVFGYHGRFSPDMYYVLFEGALVPDFSVKK